MLFGFAIVIVLQVVTINLLCDVLRKMRHAGIDPARVAAATAQINKNADKLASAVDSAKPQGS